VHPRPPRLSLIRLDAPSIDDLVTSAGSGFMKLEAQFNPPDLELAIKAVYKDQVVPGMSHPHKQFSHTDSLSTKLDLFFHATSTTTLDQVATSPGETLEVGQRVSPRMPPFTIADRERVEGFLLGLVTPRGDTLQTRSGPPAVLVHWPNFLEFEAVVLDVSFRYSMFNQLGQPVQMNASVSFEEIRDLRYTSFAAQLEGFRRTPRSSGYR
jgi:hypothetical protein